MTGGVLGRALEGMHAALAEGLAPIKLNVVLTRGINDGGVEDFVRLAERTPVEVRFIERMPFTGNDGMIPTHETLATIARILGRPLDRDVVATSTARTFAPAGFKGRLGTISPVSEPFCGRCDRLRVTSDGRVRSCLSEPNEVNIMDELRRGADEHEIARLLARAFASKPGRHSSSFVGPMRQIGG